MVFGCEYRCGCGRGCGFVDSKGTGYLVVSIGLGDGVGVGLQILKGTGYQGVSMGVCVWVWVCRQ